jgi:hypothetical protein
MVELCCLEVDFLFAELKVLELCHLILERFSCPRMDQMAFHFSDGFVDGLGQTTTA